MVVSSFRQFKHDGELGFLMTGFEMILKQLIKMLPPGVVEGIENSAKIIASKVSTFDARLIAVERQQAEILHQIYHLQNGNRCPDGCQTATANGNVRLGSYAESGDGISQPRGNSPIIDG